MDGRAPGRYLTPADYFFLLWGFVVSVTVVFGWRFAVDFFTKRPVFALRLILAMSPFQLTTSGETPFRRCIIPARSDVPETLLQL
jgi:hypothetical protein